MPSDDTLTGSHLIGEALKAAGVSTVFTLAGDHNLPLLDALADMDFRIIDTRHEAAAVHMADGWARVTGEPGVVTYTTPGFANGIPGLSSAMYSEARFSRSPARPRSANWGKGRCRRSTR